MSERMLNNVVISEGVTYRDTASNLNKTADDLQQDQIDKFSTMLFKFRNPDGKIDRNEYATLNTYLKNPDNFNADDKPVRAELRTMLDTAVAKEFNDTQLFDPTDTSYVNTLKKELTMIN
jgi:hypothetical protein